MLLLRMDVALLTRVRPLEPDSAPAGEICESREAQGYWGFADKFREGGAWSSESTEWGGH